MTLSVLSSTLVSNAAMNWLGLMALEVSGLESHIGVAGSMALVEGVGRKGLDISS